MATITKTVEVDIEEFDDDELIDELEYRGYTVVGNSSSVDLDLVDTDDLVQAVEKSGYKVIDEDLIRKELLEYIISILPETKIGGEEFFHQEAIRALYRTWDL